MLTSMASEGHWLFQYTENYHLPAWLTSAENQKRTWEAKNNFLHLQAKRLINMSGSLSGKWQRQDLSLSVWHEMSCTSHILPHPWGTPNPVTAQVRPKAQHVPKAIHVLTGLMKLGGNQRGQSILHINFKSYLSGAHTLVHDMLPELTCFAGCWRQLVTLQPACRWTAPNKETAM